MEKQESIALAFAIFNTESIDWEELKNILHRDWGIIIESKAENNILMFEVDDCRCALSYIEAPIPEQEVERNAQYSIFGRTIIEELGRHNSQIIISVLDERRKKTTKELLIKLAAGCMQLEGAIAIYHNPNVIPKDVYLGEAEQLNAERVPILLWVFIALYQGESGVSAYTVGLADFGKYEIEVLNSKQQASEILEFLFDITDYYVNQDVVFQDGETLGRTADEKFQLELSAGVAVEVESLKIHLP